MASFGGGGAYDLSDIVETLYDWGVVDVMLPFLLIFTVVFAMLQKTHILGEGKRNFNAVVALVIGLLVIVPHVTDSYPDDRYDIVVIMNEALPNVSIVVVAVVMMLLLIGLMGGKAEWDENNTASGWIAVAAFVVIIAIFGFAADWWGNGQGDWFFNFFGEESVALVVVILVFAIVIAFITRGEPSERRSSGENFMKSVGKMFKGSNK